jgi:nucleotide-binding universal stress UspA family protein
VSSLIVIGYDGSDEARHAIDAVAAILRTADAVVANVWSPMVVPATATPLAAPATPPPSDDQDAQLELAARRVVDEGVERASDVGLRARSELRCGAAGDVGRLLGQLADEYEADLVVVGRRGVSRLEAVVLGSVSNDTVRQSRRPVLVVPYADD